MAGVMDQIQLLSQQIEERKRKEALAQAQGQPPAPTPGQPPGQPPAPGLPIGSPPAPGMSLLPGQIQLPKVEVPDPQGVLANPLAPLYAGQYPTLEKYKGVEPAMNGQLGPKSNLQDVLNFQQQQGQLAGRLDSLTPDAMMRNVAGLQAMVGHGYNDLERARFQGVASAAEQGAKTMAATLPELARQAGDQGKQQLELGKFKAAQAEAPIALNLKAKELEDRIRIANINRAMARDQSLERYIQANPNAQPPQIDAFIKQMDAARELMAEDRGVAPGGQAVGQAGAQPVGLAALQKASMDKLLQAQQQKVKAEGAMPDPKNVENVLGLVSGKDYNVPNLLTALGNDARLVSDPVSLERITAAMKAKFGDNPEYRKDLLKAATLAANEATGNNGADVMPLGETGVSLRKHSGLLGLSSGYNLERGGQTLAEMPKWYSGPGAGLVSPNETLFPTWKAGTKAQHSKNASILGALLNKIY